AARHDRRQRRGARDGRRYAGSNGPVSEAKPDGHDRPEAGRPAQGPGVDAPAGYSFGTKAVHAGLTPDPSYGSVIPAIHQTSTYAQPAPGEFAEDFDYSR